jgi:hypothetical protein
MLGLDALKHLARLQILRFFRLTILEPPGDVLGLRLDVSGAGTLAPLRPPLPAVLRTGYQSCVPGQNVVADHVGVVVTCTSGSPSMCSARWAAFSTALVGA